MVSVTSTSTSGRLSSCDVTDESSDEDLSPIILHNRRPAFSFYQQEVIDSLVRQSLYVSLDESDNNNITNQSLTVGSCKSVDLYSNGRSPTLDNQSDGKHDSSMTHTAQINNSISLSQPSQEQRNSLCDDDGCSSYKGNSRRSPNSRNKSGEITDYHNNILVRARKHHSSVPKDIESSSSSYEQLDIQTFDTDFPLQKASKDTPKENSSKMSTSSPTAPAEQTLPEDPAQPNEYDAVFKPCLKSQCSTVDVLSDQILRQSSENSEEHRQCLQSHCHNMVADKSSQTDESEFTLL